VCRWRKRARGFHCRKRGVSRNGGAHCLRRASRSNRNAFAERRCSRPSGRFVCRFAGPCSRVRIVLAGRLHGRAASATAREKHPRIGGSGPEICGTPPFEWCRNEAKRKTKAPLRPPPVRKRATAKKNRALGKRCRGLRTWPGTRMPTRNCNASATRSGIAPRVLHSHGHGSARRSRVTSSVRTPDFIALLFTDFIELHGDRGYADDKAIITGLGSFMGGPWPSSAIKRGATRSSGWSEISGSPNPRVTGKRYALMQLAAKFGGRFSRLSIRPGVSGNRRGRTGQGEAIARNLREMARLPVPVIVT